MRAIRSFLVIAVAIMAVGALAAVSVSALTVQSEWVVEGTPFSELELAEEEESLSGGPLSLLVPSKSLTVKCGVVSGSSTIVQGGTEEIEASLSECSVVGAAACAVSKPLALNAKTELIYAGETYYDKLVPLTAEGAMMTVVITGKECAFVGETKVKGAVAAKVPSEELVKRSMVFSESTSKIVNEGLKGEEEAELALTYGSSTAFLSGEWTAQIAGGRAGQARDLEPYTTLCEGTEKDHGGCNGTVVGTSGAVTTKKLVSMKFKYGTTSITCTESKIEGNLASAGAAPLPADTTAFVFNTCTNDAGGAACPVKAPAKSYRLMFRTYGLAGIGSMTVQNPKLEIACAGTTCEYGETKVRLQVNSGSPGKLDEAPRTLKRISGPAGTCGASVTWEGAGGGGDIEYEFVSPKPIALTG